ncbi:hypothetical protein C0993_011388 [Termitomyces sp. T159_Od127]|nr:hypothetical protein C0993_011388 [Termitomyces sp. T159_Od127]
MAGNRATRAVPQVIIWMLPPPKPSTPQVDFYAFMKQAVKRDGNNTIVAVLQFPPFAQAVVGFCETARAFPGTPVDCARYLSAIGWRFADQADFGRIADQKGLADKLSPTL